MTTAGLLMYRPTVRYSDEFKDYVDRLFHDTSLDRNQIIRLALFVLGHSKEGKEILDLYSTSSLPSPSWTVSTHGLWYGSDGFKQPGVGTSGSSDVGTSTSLEGVTSSVQENGLEGSKREITQRKGTVHQDPQDSQQSTIVTGTGISFRVGGAVLLPRR